MTLSLIGDLFFGILGRGIFNNAVTDSTSGIYRSLKGLYTVPDDDLKSVLIQLDLEAKLRLINSLMGLRSTLATEQISEIIEETPRMLLEGPQIEIKSEPEHLSGAGASLSDFEINGGEIDGGEIDGGEIDAGEIDASFQLIEIIPPKSYMVPGPEESPVRICMEHVYESVTRIRDLLNRVHETVMNHRQKWFSQWRTPTYHLDLRQLKIQTNILEERLNYLIKIAMLLTSQNDKL